jgi:hypothetical protein
VQSILLQIEGEHDHHALELIYILLLINLVYKLYSSLSDKYSLFFLLMQMKTGLVTITRGHIMLPTTTEHQTTLPKNTVMVGSLDHLRKILKVQIPPNIQNTRVPGPTHPNLLQTQATTRTWTLLMTTCQPQQVIC